MHPKILTYAPGIILLQWELEAGSDTSDLIWQWDAYINEHYRDQLIETVIGYREIALYVRPGISIQALVDRIERIDLQRTKASDEVLGQITLPVCYGGDFGPDLEQVAQDLGLTPEVLIELHSTSRYQAAFLGFLPGFAYLNGLDERLHYPRKSNPRPVVAAGAVGIGGSQTGVYPTESPGGWQIIGRCPIPMFDIAKSPAALIRAGNIIRFRPISEAEYELLTIEVHTETFQFDQLGDD